MFHSVKYTNNNAFLVTSPLAFSPSSTKQLVFGRPYIFSRPFSIVFKKVNDFGVRLFRIEFLLGVPFPIRFVFVVFGCVHVPKLHVLPLLLLLLLTRVLVYFHFSSFFERQFGAYRTHRFRRGCKFCVAHMEWMECVLLSAGRWEMENGRCEMDDRNE